MISDDLTLIHPLNGARFVSSKDKLADALGISVPTVSRMLREPGCPGRTQNGSYSVEAWQSFVETRKLAGGDLEGESAADEKSQAREYALRERKAKAELAELRVQKERGELVAVVEVEKAAREFAMRLRKYHERACTVEAVSELAGALGLEGREFSVLLEFFERFHENFCRKITATSLDTPPQSA